MGRATLEAKRMFLHTRNLGSKYSPLSGTTKHGDKVLAAATI